MNRIILAVPLVSALLLTGCSGESGGSGGPAGIGGRGQSGSPKQPLALVSTVVAAEKSVPIDVSVTGNVEPYTAIRVKSLVSGQLIKVHFQEGQDVKKGDLLFSIDPRPFDETIRQVEANLARNNALLRQAQANLQRDMASEKFAREQAARYQKLFSEGVTSKQLVDQYASDADARGEGILADQAAIESAQASIGADKASLANARLQRGYCEIYSPVDGRTGDLAVEEGNLVQANAVELVTINQVRPIYVTFSVPERRLPDVRKYMAAGKLTVLAGPPDSADPAERGTLTFIDNAVDSTTGTVKLKGTFANTDNGLWPGQFVNVSLRLTTIPNAVVVPVRAVQMGPSGQYAYVIGRDMKAEMRPVVTGLRLAGDEVVVEKGLRGGETVVTEGQLRIAPGMTVRTRGGRSS
jgi:multidrug efflux system membrane fusion protein